SLPYGKGFLQVNIPEDVYYIITKKNTIPPINLKSEFQKNLYGKLNSFRDKKVGIAIPDITRYNISSKVLPFLVDELKEIRVRKISIIIGSGLHRPASQEDIKYLIPPLSMDVEVIPHNAIDDSVLVYLGETSRKTPIFINRHFIESEKRIVLGTIEPHQFAGFTGGNKGVVIGLGGYKTIKINHSLLKEQNARLGVLEGNPVREDIDEAGEIIGIDLMINCVLNEKKEIIGVFVGDIKEEYRKGVELVKQISMIESPEVDIVIASPGGFPKDIDMYQAQKALAHSELIVRDGGIIILVAECREGIGNELFYQTMNSTKTPSEVIKNFIREGFEIGPHKAFLLSRTLERVKVFMVSSLPKETVKNLFMVPFDSVDEALKKALKELGRGSRIAVLPNASSIIPIKEGNSAKRN
ncbi:MAG: nickel-dependent lactate racemase, partial [bacterium]